MINETKIITSWWTRNQKGRDIGFVLTENFSGVRKIYVGNCTGMDVDGDERDITEKGGKIHAGMIESMLKQLKEKGKFE